MPCSAVTLSLATITSIIAVALLTISFATDNWLYIEVKRTNIQVFMNFFYALLSRVFLVCWKEVLIVFLMMLEANIFLFNNT